MAKQNKSLALSNPATNTSTTIYKVPTGKYAVAKSVVINNSSNADLTFRLIIGGAYVAYTHTLKSRDTLVINDLDFPLLPGEEIVVLASSSSLTIRVSGFENDYVASEYPYMKVNALPVSNIGLIAKNSDVIIRSVIICNTGAAVTNIYVGAPWTITSKDIKPYDSLLLLNLQYYVPESHNIGYQQTLGTGGTVTFILEKVVQ
ncbi:hypothetical protein DC345_30180 [Paenibacillus taichungensis]|uniref:Uncharacterized protein n=1 Tax=Paenibacillus taichungensis TaxID=484184 RepID=A0A329QCJ2_9BACL|nr:hypothetical protein [Paenibacillus taichungensis]RAW09731.1 hypothetical protein DC345_30180 [Paenibacillus taichungensis]